MMKIIIPTGKDMYSHKLQHVIPFWFWILCCRLWRYVKIWHSIRYHEIKRGRHIKQITIYGVCFFKNQQVKTHITGTYKTRKKRNPKMQNVSQEWKNLAESTKENSCVPPDINSITSNRQTLQQKTNLQPTKQKVRCKWRVSGEVRDISDRNSH